MLDAKYFRHTKKSIDINKKVCGKCHGKLAYAGSFNRDGTAKKQREANGFSLFVKNNFSTVKKHNGKI